MSHFCFVSFLQPGHLDFGGRSFVRLAQELIKMGHRVTWTFSYSELKDFSERVITILKEAGIDCDYSKRFYLTVPHHRQSLMESAAELERVIRARNYDCLVIDRLCIGAGYAAEWAGVPWAVVGTDGRQWARTRSRDGEVMLGPKAGTPDHHDHSMYQRHMANTKLGAGNYWAASPYLNMSFFPREYFSEVEPANIPAHSHFLGSGGDTAALAKGEMALISLGNSFNPEWVTPTISCVLTELEKRAVAALLLTGSNELTDKLSREFKVFGHLRIESWMPYEKAYSMARLAIGHGGTSHIWTGMHHAVPLLAIPSKGDQVYGAKQLERLNIGLAVNTGTPANPNSSRAEPGVDPVTNRDELFVKDCTAALTRLLDDASIEASCHAISGRMRGGGGIHAGVLLLEQLVNKKGPITQCADGRCCC